MQEPCENRFCAFYCLRFEKLIVNPQNLPLRSSRIEDRVLSQLRLSTYICTVLAKYATDKFEGVINGDNNNNNY